MELKFLLCCLQICRDLHADSRGKQNPHHERVKHEPVAWDAESQQLGTLGGGAEGREHGEQSPFSRLFAHSSPGQQPGRFANSVDPFSSINYRVSICKTCRPVTNPGAFVVTMVLGDFPVSFSCPIPRPYHSTPKQVRVATRL